MKRINKRSPQSEYFYVFCSFYVTRENWDSGEIMDGIFKLNRLPSLAEMKRAAKTIAHKQYRIADFAFHRLSIINYKFIDEDEFQMLIGDLPVENYFDIDEYQLDEKRDIYKKKVTSN